MARYEMNEAEFLDYYMYEQECIQMQLDQDYQEYRDMMDWGDEEEDEFWEQQAERNVYDY